MENEIGEMSAGVWEVVRWKIFVAFVCGMRLAAHMATIRATAAEDSHEES